MTLEQRQRFTEFLQSVKFPDGLAGNLKKNVTADGKLTGLKSHDCHVILQRLLVVGIRHFVPKAIQDTISELCHFFKLISSRTLRVEDLERAQNSIVEILCKIEMIFPPAFFYDHGSRGDSSIRGSVVWRPGSYAVDVPF